MVRLPPPSVRRYPLFPLVSAALASAVITVLGATAPTFEDLSAPVGAASSQQASLVIPGATDRLDAVPLANLEALEPAVAEQFQQAVRSLSDVIARGTRGRPLGEAYGAFARVFHAYEVFDTAEAGYRNAIRLADALPTWRYLLAYLFQQTGRLEEAARELETVRRRWPAMREAAVRLGAVYLQLDRLADAREQFESVSGAFPAAAHNGLGEIALRQKRFGDAVRHFQAVLERLPQATEVHYSLAMAYRGQGRLAEARRHLDLRGAGGVRAADPLVDELGSLIRGERGLLIRGRRAYDAGRFEEAAEAFRKAVEAAPASPAPHVNLGLALAGLGDGAGAAAAFEAALRLDPASAAARAGLGQVLARSGRDEDAVAHLQIALSASPEDAATRSELVRALVRLGRDEAAIAVLMSAGAGDLDDEDSVVALSILLADRGRFAEAVSVLERAHRQFPDRVATATTLARILASAPDRAVRNGGRALEIAMAVHAADPAPVHAETVALALAALARCDEARLWIDRAVNDAEASGDRTEATRLRRERQMYSEAGCPR